MKNIEKIQDCLIGGAVGDALGYTVEFMKEDDIFDRFGLKGITQYVISDGVALISDDTQMTLFRCSNKHILFTLK